MTISCNGLKKIKDVPFNLGQEINNINLQIEDSKEKISVLDSQLEQIDSQINEVIQFPLNIWIFGDYSLNYTEGSTWKFKDFDITDLIKKNTDYKFKVSYINNHPSAELGKIIGFASDGNSRIYQKALPISENTWTEFNVPANPEITKVIIRFQTINDTPATEDATATYKGMYLYESNDVKKLKNDVVIDGFEKLKTQSSKGEYVYDNCFTCVEELWSFGDYSSTYKPGDTWKYKDFEVLNKLKLNTLYRFTIGNVLSNPRPAEDTYIGTVLQFNNDTKLEETKLTTDKLSVTFNVNPKATSIIVRLQTLSGEPSATTGTMYYQDMSLIEDRFNDGLIILNDNVSIEKLNRLENTVSGLLGSKDKWIKAESKTLNNDTIQLENNNIGINKKMLFSANVNSFSSLLLGHGKTSYGSAYLEITSTTVNVYKYTNSASLVKTYEHGLTIEGYINILVETNISQKATIRIITPSGISEQANIIWEGNNGTIFVQSIDSDLTNAKVKWTCTDYDKKIHICGDSYCGITSNSRLPYYLAKWGYETFLLDSYPGRNSVKAYESLLLNLQHSSPEYIVWTMGMNDPDLSADINFNWLNTVNKLISLCEQNNIELILCTIPNVKGGVVDDSSIDNSRNHTFKNDWIRNSGYRYIDFCEAVGADISNEWYEGMLGSDGVHPSTTGALALASRLVQDFSEITYI